MGIKLTEQQEKYCDFGYNVLREFDEIRKDKTEKKAIYIENYNLNEINTFEEPELKFFLNKINSQEYINSNLNKIDEDIVNLLKKIEIPDNEITWRLYPETIPGIRQF